VSAANGDRDPDGALDQPTHVFGVWYDWLLRQGRTSPRGAPAYRDGVAQSYSVEQARRVLAELRPVIDDLITVRADAAELGAAVHHGVPSPLGGLPELKAAQARFDERLSSIAATGLQIKGVAPLLLDFPAELGGEPVLLCWLEGDVDLAWYHRVDVGFAGRRRLPPRAEDAG
jgi:hypothetical protein